MTTPIDGENYTGGIAYIALPVDMDRDRYVGLCYKTNNVCIRTEQGAFFKNVAISETNLNFIDFPLKVNDLGSPVVYISEPTKGQIFIVSVLTNSQNISDNVEHQFKFKRKYEGTIVEIVGSAKQRFLTFNINSDDKPGTFYVNINNKNTDSLIKLEVGGDFELVSHKNTTLTASEKSIIQTISQDDKNKKSTFEQTVSENHFDGEKFTINNGTEAMVRGDKIKDLLLSFFDDLSKAMVLDPISGSIPFDPGTVIIIQSYKTKLEDILSTKSFLE